MTVFTLGTILIKSHDLLLLIVISIGVTILCVYNGAVVRMTKMISDYQQPGIKDFIMGLKYSLKASLLFSVMFSVFMYIVLIVFPFYLNMHGVYGFIGVSTISWVSLVLILAFQYYYTINARLEKKITKVIKKCFIIFFDNPGFSIVLILGSLTLSGVSLFFGFILPGFAAVMLWNNVGLKILLYKYDYLEAHPSADRSKIPWKDLIHKDRGTIGKRTLKEMIFPWKE